MPYIIAGAVVALIIFVATGFSFGKVLEWKLNKKQILSVVGVFIMVGACYVSVPTGHTGVVTTFGKVEDFTLEAGVHFKLPWQEVVKMDNRVQKQTLDMQCFSSDIQEVSMTYTVNYQINKNFGVYMDGSNLLNCKYYDYAGYMARGARGSLGLTMSF